MADPQPPQEAGTINTDQAARLLMIGPERVRQLVKDGWIVRLDRDRYRLVDVVQGYLRFRNDAERRATKSGADARVRDARAQEIEIRTAERVGDLVPIDEFDAMVDGIAGLFRSELSGLPARFTRDLQLRRMLERELNGILDRIADRAEQIAARLPQARPLATAFRKRDAGPMGDPQPELPSNGGDPGSA